MLFKKFNKLYFSQVGDGTTSVTLLAVEFLRQVKSLIEESVHPQVIIRGFRKATRLALEKIKEIAFIEFCYNLYNLIIKQKLK